MDDDIRRVKERNGQAMEQEALGNKVGKGRNLPMLWWMLEIALPGKWWIIRNQGYIERRRNMLENCGA